MIRAIAPSLLQRITVVTEENVEKRIVRAAVELGADSYICSYCSGKPLHAAFGGVSPLLVRIELLATPEAAEAIVQRIGVLQEENYPITAIVDPVKVCV